LEVSRAAALSSGGFFAIRPSWNCAFYGKVIGTGRIATLVFLLA
jgi:hypothetical protein